MWVGPAFKMLFSDYTTRGKSNTVYQGQPLGVTYMGEWICESHQLLFPKKLRVSVGSVCPPNKQNFITVSRTIAFVISVRDLSGPDWGQNAPELTWKWCDVVWTREIMGVKTFWPPHEMAFSFFFLGLGFQWSLKQIMDKKDMTQSDWQLTSS